LLDWLILAAIGAAALLPSGNKTSTIESSAGKTGGGSLSASPGLSNDEFLRKMEEWRSQWEPTIDRNRWIPAGTASRILAKYPAPEREPRWLYDQSSALRKLAAELSTHNEGHVEKQRERLKAFFDTVEKNPLTDEQALACICMDHNVQIIASAGSGKTSTMVAKTGYVLHEGLAKPDQVLLLAFNSDAANELRIRVGERLAGFEAVEKITAKTFHSFGIEVIAAATGKKPSLAPWVEQGNDGREIISIVKSLRNRDQAFGRNWDLFRTVFGRDVGRWDDRAEPEAFGNGRVGFRTANGEIVKSKQERQIANWLFYHSVAYEYENSYEHDTADQKFRQYRPDFYYPEIELYHEHFALDREGRPPRHLGSRYLEGVKWKREKHAQMGTSFFETTSYEISAGLALQKLEQELTSRGVTVRFDPERTATGSQPVSDSDLASTLRVFQRHAKSNGLSRDDLRQALAKQSKDGNKDRLSLFLSIYERVSDEWERRLADGGYIDFEDMLLVAAKHVENGAYKSPFTVVLADEFQDSSRARMRLLKALTKNEDGQVHLCVVGDDWQAINRFAGADISVMTEFEKTFEHATRLTLTKTFRCPRLLCDASSAFVQANPTQIRKAVSSANSYAKASLIAYGFNDLGRAESHLEGTLEQMHGFVRDGRLKPNRGDRVTVLVLGRYRSDKPERLERWQNRFGDRLEINFRTIHASKGLEAEYVMILNAVEGTRGLPSQIDDDPVLLLAMPAPDPYPMAEERRLFYVALTRASKQVRIYTSLTHPSRFLTELEDSKALTIEPVDGERMDACPRCRVGVLTTRKGKFGPFQSCSTYPRCDFKRSMPSDAASPLGTTRS
jgi:DNA helicase-4